MDLTVSIPEFRRALAGVKRVIDRRYGGVWRGVRLVAGGGVLTVQATNRETTITKVVPATVRSAGEAIVPAADLAKLAVGKGVLVLTLDDDSLSVVSGPTTINMQSIPPEEWAHVPNVDGECIEIDLTAAAEVAAFACGSDETQAVLRCVYFSGADMVATDRYRLAVHRVEGASFPDVLVPAQAITEAARAGDGAAMYVGERAVKIVVGSTTVVAFRVDQEFPRYGVFLPAQSSDTLQVKRADIAQLAKSLSAKCLGGAPLRLYFDGVNNTLTGIAGALDAVRLTETIPAKVSGSFPEVLALNPLFLHDLVSSLRDDYITIQLGDRSKSFSPIAVIEPRAGAEAIRLLVPVRWASDT